MENNYKKFHDSSFKVLGIYKRLLKMWEVSEHPDRDLIVQDFKQSIKALEEQAVNDMYASESWEEAS
jgi:hypothetical protein